MIIALDPGTYESAVLKYDGKRVYSPMIAENEQILTWLSLQTEPLIYEMVACYGMPVGAEVFETCVWIGRFIQVTDNVCAPMYRKDVKMHLCQSMRAKDANVTQALTDRFGPGRPRAVGKKKFPGPLYGVKRHLWQALGVAVTWWDTSVSVEPKIVEVA